MFLMHVGLVTPPFIASHCQRLAHKLWEMSGEAYTPVNLLWHLLKHSRIVTLHCSLLETGSDYMWGEAYTRAILFWRSPGLSRFIARCWRLGQTTCVVRPVSLLTSNTHQGSHAPSLTARLHHGGHASSHTPILQQGTPASSHAARLQQGSHASLQTVGCGGQGLYPCLHILTSSDAFQRNMLHRCHGLAYKLKMSSEASSCVFLITLMPSRMVMLHRSLPETGL